MNTAKTTSSRILNQNDAAARDVQPTPERLAKSAFKRRKTFKVISTVETLSHANAIGEAEVAAASRLRRDWLYVKYGYQEYYETRPCGQRLIHNALSWQMTRAQMGVMLSDLRHAVKGPIYTLLELMLIDEMSFSAMARVLMPQLCDNALRNKVSAQCALALRTLAAVYEDMDRARRNDRRLGAVHAINDAALKKKMQKE